MTIVDGELVVIINRTMAKQYWPDEDPINRRVRTDPNIWLRIVGVVEDVHHVSLNRDPVTEMYPPDRADRGAGFHAGRPNRRGSVGAGASGEGRGAG